MDELLQKLLDAEILSEETKKELEETFNNKMNEVLDATKKETEANVRTELTEQWFQDRDALIEALDAKVDQFLSTELSELKEDIDRFRDLEAEHAEKLVEAKAQMSNELKNDLVELVEKIDAFLEIRLTSELDELREDIEEQRKNIFGRRIFEAFVDEYSSNYADDDSVEGTLRETQERLNDTQQALEEAERKLSKVEREQKLEKILSPLSGRQRDVMEAILKNVSTDQLEEGYKTFIGRVIRESEEEVSEKEDKVLAEGTSNEGKKEKKVVIITGDNEDLLNESKVEEQKANQLSAEARSRIQRLAGLK